ncbi:MAG: VOC family protein [Actinomycetota bacterium]|nr:VOC family protein [Actinomycetota bacterium]
MSRPRFHLAFPVHDLEVARWFYGSVLGCPEGRSAPEWVDFDLWGHQIVAHHDASVDPMAVSTNPVDGEDVPARHFGLLLHDGAWRNLVSCLQAADVPFLIQPQVRFAGQPGEQLTCFVLDPSGNALEFKAFADDRSVFRV